METKPVPMYLDVIVRTKSGSISCSLKALLREMDRARSATETYNRRVFADALRQFADSIDDVDGIRV